MNKSLTTKTNRAVSPKKSPEILDLKRAVSLETERRAIMTEFISQHMEKGVDYGPIHISKNCENKYSPEKCKIRGHWSKDSLFKPGTEKFCSLLKLTPKYRRDSETWEMLGSPAGTVALICELYDQKGNIVGEGRGVCTVAEKASANTAVKIAEKRAKTDAVLSTGGLSDFFTQDVEDDVNAGSPALTAPQESQKVSQTSQNGSGQVESPKVATNLDKVVKAKKDMLQKIVNNGKWTPDKDLEAMTPQEITDAYNDYLKSIGK
jgi:hypothetical protein